MSRKRKKTETTKVSPLTDTGYRVPISPELMGYFRGRSPLDIELESEDVMLARDIKSLRVEELNMKRRARMAKLKKEIEKIEKENESMDSDKSDIPRISVAMAQQIANLPPEERNKVIETYAMFSSIDRSKGKGESMLPLLIGFSKSNPGTPQTNMLDYAKAMGDQLKTGIDLAKAFTAKEKPSNAMEFMKVMKDVIIEGVRNPMLQAIKEAQPQQSAFEQILTNPDMFSRMQGMFGGGSGTKGQVDLEIEKLRGERALSGQKIDLEYRKMMLESEAKDRRTDSVLAALGPLSTILAGPVSQRMQQLGEQQGAAHIPPATTPSVVAVPPTGTTILIKCKCGFEGPMNFPGAVPAIIKCPECSQELVVGGTPPGNIK